MRDCSRKSGRGTKVARKRTGSGQPEALTAWWAKFKDK